MYLTIFEQNKQCSSVNDVRSELVTFFHVFTSVHFIFPWGIQRNISGVCKFTV